MALIDQLEKALNQTAKKRSVISKLGFFSKPFRVVTDDGQEWVLKTYKPIGSTQLIDQIIQNHADYIDAMREIGVLIPHTEIHTRKVGNKQQLIVAQAPYKQDELVRTIMETATKEQFLKVLGMLLLDTLNYWTNLPNQAIGFHPTLRNYALREDKLYYFDTFPPMLMPQQELNAIILEMAPVKFRVRPFIPLSAINRVSDEYYQKDKMLIGIVGSCCRLRPEFTEEILTYVKRFFRESELLDEEEKQQLIDKVQAPPELPAIWVFVRKLLGKQGKPNIKQ